MVSPCVSEENQAQAGLLVARDQVRRYKKQLERTEVCTREVVKELVKEKKKSRALTALRKLKYVEEGIQACEEHLLRLENAGLELENTRGNEAIYEAMRAGTDLLQRLNQKVSVDDAQKLMGDTEAAYAYQQELDYILIGTNMHEEALLQELESAVQLAVPVSLQPSAAMTANTRQKVLPA